FRKGRAWFNPPLRTLPFRTTGVRAGCGVLQRERTHAMRRMGWAFGLALLAAAGLGGTPAGADDKGNPFEAWEKSARPGPQHKMLEGMAGSWTFTSKF